MNKKIFNSLFTMERTSLFVDIISCIAWLISLYISIKPINNDDEKVTQISNNIVEIKKADSSKVDIKQFSQSNSNKGDVKNEYVLGDKIVYESPKNSLDKLPRTKQRNKILINENSHVKQPLASAKQETYKIENKGNLSIGQTGGVVNQETHNHYNTPLKPRHIEDFIKKFKAIPLDYTVIVGTNPNDEECRSFKEEVILYFRNLGYDVKS